MSDTYRSVSIPHYNDELEKLHDDTTQPLFITNLVYLTSDESDDSVDYRIMYSLLDKKPKRALVYCFVNITVTDDPYECSYKINTFNTDHIIKVHLYLGFRKHQHINVYLKQIVQDLMKQGIIKNQDQKYSVTKGRDVGDFYFIILNEELTSATRLTLIDNLVLRTKLMLKKIVVKPKRWFGLIIVMCKRKQFR